MKALKDKIKLNEKLVCLITLKICRMTSLLKQIQQERSYIRRMKPHSSTLMHQQLLSPVHRRELEEKMITAC